MRRWLVLLACGAWLGGAGQGCAGQTRPEGAVLRFHFVRPGLQVTEFTFEVLEAGGGTYRAKGVPVKASTNKYSMAGQGGAAETVQALSLTRVAVEKLFGLVRATNGLRGCASKAKGIADTGAKEISFVEDGHLKVSCDFNYSESRPVTELTGMFQAMAFTLDEARKMEGEQRFDRLGLDRDMTILVEAVKDGQAMGLSNIRGLLQGLVDDPAVLERVRVQAGKLLEQSAITP